MENLTKEEILSEIKRRRGEFTKEEMLSVMAEGEKPVDKKPDGFFSKTKLISNTAYFVGGLIVILGVFLFVSEFWELTGSFLKVSVTFGLGMLIYFFVVYLEVYDSGPKKLKIILAILIAFLVFVGGLVIFYEYVSNMITPGVYLVVSTLLSFMFGSLFFFRRSALYLFFIILFSTSVIYSAIFLETVQVFLMGLMVNPILTYVYISPIIGAVYLYLANILKQESMKALVFILYFFGVWLVAGSLFFLADDYSSPFLNILGLLSLIAFAFWAYRLERMEIFFSGMFIFLGFLFSFVFSEFFSFNIIAVTLSFMVAVIIMLRIKNAKFFPYFFLITISVTSLPYVILSFDFFQTGISTLDNPGVVYLLLTSIIGISYLFSAYSLKNKFIDSKNFSRFLYAVGSFVFVVPMFEMANIFTGLWDLLTSILIFAVLGLGIYLHERILIISGGLLLSINIILVSYRYFAESVGWPLVLIFGGLSLMGVGYLSYYLSKKISSRELEN